MKRKTKISALLQCQLCVKLVAISHKPCTAQNAAFALIVGVFFGFWFALPA